MKKRKIMMSVLIAAMLASCVACGNTNKDVSDKTKNVTESVSEVVSDTEEVSEVPAQDIKVDDLKDLTDKGVITGVKDITVEEGTDVDLNELVYADKDIVKSVDIDDSAVDYSKAGTYEVIYTITFNGDKFRDYVDENNVQVNFNTDGDTIVVKTTVTVTVATKEDTEKAIENGDTSVVTDETKESVKNDNKSKANDNAVVSTPSKTGNSTGNAGNGNNNTGANNSANAGANSGANNGANNSNNKPADTPKDNTNNKPTDTPKNDTPSKPREPHVHNYIEVSHTDATCTASGTVTKKCSCGATITENSGNALGHNFVHHDAVTHTEQKLVKDAYDDSVKETHYFCNGCGAEFNNEEDMGVHLIMNPAGNCNNYHSDVITLRGGYHDAVYETVTVTDTPAYDECSRCGARK